MQKKRRGFTLFEAIISVAIIAISSAVILQVFYTAGTLSSRASDIDTASAIMTQAIDVSKNVVNSTMFFNNDEIFKSMNYDETSEDYRVYTYYDKDWNAIEDKSKDIPENAKFMIEYKLKEEIIYDDSVYDKFYIFGAGDIISSVDTMQSEGILYTIEAKASIVKNTLFINNVGDLSNDTLITLSGSKFIGNGK